MKKERDISQAPNLRNTDPALAELIDKYNIKHQILTEYVLNEDWALATDEGSRKRLIGKFRNKLMGFGKITPVEHKRLQEVLLNIANDIEHAVNESIAQRILKKKKLIQEVLDDVDEETLARALAEKKKRG